MSDKTILVIDDSATIRKLVDTHLSPAGYRVVLAPNAEDGLKLAARSRTRPDSAGPSTARHDRLRSLLPTG